MRLSLISRPARIPAAVAPLFIYIILALGFFGKTGGWTRWFLGKSFDAIAFIWFINWWPFSIAHGLNPFISNYVWFPPGNNLTWATSVPSAALLGLPVTLLGGAVLCYNLLTLLAPALSAWTAFLLTRQLTRDWAAALVGGYLFGFSSYEAGQILGHLNLDLTFLVPLAILLCVRHVRGELRRIPFIICLALLLLVEFGLSTEIFATLCVFGAMAWIIFLLCAPAIDRQGLWRLAIDILFACVVMLMPAAPFLFYLVKGFSDGPLIITSETITNFSADLLNFLIPTHVTWLGRTAFAPVADIFTGNASEQGAYLGLPLILLVTLYFRNQIVHAYVRALLIAMILIVVLSLGPWLHVYGMQTKIPLPWRFVENLPLIRAALPARFTMYVSLISAIVAALYLATPEIGRWRPWRFALAGLACLFLVPNSRVFVWTRWPTQQFFTAQNVNLALGIKPDGTKPNVIILPFSYTGPGMAWQMDAQMQFTQWGGYAGFLPYSELIRPNVGPVYSALTAGVPGPTFGNDLAAFCATHHIDYILIGPGTPALLVAAIAARNWPQHVDHGINVVKVPPPAALDYYETEGDYWPSAAPQNWMGRQFRVITHGSPVTLTINEWRPDSAQADSTPMQITTSGKSGNAVYTIGPTTAQVIQVPADTVLTVTADHTFVPDKVFHNGDTRNLSVLVSLALLPR
jgi:hypothetical protein